MKKLGFYTTSSPLYGAKLAFWRHHDALFNILCEEYDVEIHVILPVYGGDTQLESLYKGNRNVLYPTLRNMNIHFYPPETSTLELKCIWDSLDALYLDDVHTFDSLGNRSKKDMENLMLDCLNTMISKGKPIVLSDTDGFATDILEGKEAFLKTIYEILYDSHYHNYYVVSPFIASHLKEGTKLIVAPFEIDRRTLNLEYPDKSERQYFSRLVKNMYYNEYYLPILEGMSKCGPVLVNGNGWKPYIQKYPSIEFKTSIPMLPSTVNEVYNSAVTCMIGRNQYHIDWGTVLIQYRWKECLQAGIIIIPENISLYKEWLPEGSITTDDFLNNLEYCKVYFNTMSDQDYKNIVEMQRKVALEYFEVHNWVPLFLELFDFKN